MRRSDGIQLTLGLPPTPRKKRRAGRPRIHRAGEAPHKQRARIKRYQPAHVTLRTTPAARDLRRRQTYRAVQRAMYRACQRRDFRICHISVQTGHIHLVVEANDHVALARGMQGFEISCARHINRALSRRAGESRKGRVFADRYHMRVQRSPRQMRNTLAYVLCNWRKHGDDARARVRLDPYSSGPTFDGWRHRATPHFWPVDLDPLPVVRPRTWMLATGWRQHGLLDPVRRPGPR